MSGGCCKGCVALEKSITEISGKSKMDFKSRECFVMFCACSTINARTNLLPIKTDWEFELDDYDFFAYATNSLFSSL